MAEWPGRWADKRATRTYQDGCRALYPRYFYLLSIIILGLYIINPAWTLVTTTLRIATSNHVLSNVTDETVGSWHNISLMVLFCQ